MSKKLVKFIKKELSSFLLVSVEAITINEYFIDKSDYSMSLSFSVDLPVLAVSVTRRCVVNNCNDLDYCYVVL